MFCGVNPLSRYERYSRSAMLLSYLPLAPLAVTSDFSYCFRRYSGADAHPAVTAVLCGTTRCESGCRGHDRVDVCAVPAYRRPDVGTHVGSHGTAPAAAREPGRYADRISDSCLCQSALDRFFGAYY